MGTNREKITGEIDLEKITADKNIKEINRIVFHVTPERNPNIDIKIEVFKSPEGFRSNVSHAFWGPGNAGNPYLPIHHQQSIEAAVIDAFPGYMNDSEEFPNDVVFYVTIDPDTYEDMDYIDGNGSSVTIEEARKKIDQWREKNAPDIA